MAICVSTILLLTSVAAILVSLSLGKDKVPGSLVALLTIVFVLSLAIWVGVVVQANSEDEFKAKLNSVGIDRIETHEFLVDGRVVSNCAEIVWMKKKMTAPPFQMSMVNRSLMR